MIASLLRWGDRWMSRDGTPPLELVHRRCGHRTSPTLTCSECGDSIDARDMKAQLHTPRNAGG